MYRCNVLLGKLSKFDTTQRRMWNKVLRENTTEWYRDERGANYVQGDQNISRCHRFNEICRKKPLKGEKKLNGKKLISNSKTIVFSFSSFFKVIWMISQTHCQVKNWNNGYSYSAFFSHLYPLFSFFFLFDFPFYVIYQLKGNNFHLFYRLFNTLLYTLKIQLLF